MWPCDFYGPGSVVGIATGYGLDGPGIESRWGARFSAPVQTGPGAHPVSCMMGTGSFPGIKSGRGVTLTPQPPLVPWSCTVTTLSPLGRYSSVSIATGYGLDGPGIESRWERDFPHLSRPALGPTQPSVQWVPGLSQG